jgi:hypothetical protein
VGGLTDSYLPNREMGHPILFAWRATNTYRKLSLSGYMVLAADQAAGIVARRYVTKTNVMGQAAEERNTFSNKHRDAGDCETLDEARAQELLNGDSTVDVDVVGATGSKLRDDLSRRAGHLFHDDASRRDEIAGARTQGATAEDHDALVAVWPRFKLENGLEGMPAHHNRIHACQEFLEAVGFTPVRG